MHYAISKEKTSASQFYEKVDIILLQLLNSIFLYYLTIYIIIANGQRPKIL